MKHLARGISPMSTAIDKESILTTKERNTYYNQCRQMLQENPAFAGLSEAHLDQLIERVKVEEFKRGEILIKQNDEARYFYLLLDGQVRVIDEASEPPQLINLMENGNFFGTRAFIRNEKRSATLEVMVDAHVIRFNRDDWNWLLSISPSLRNYFDSLEQDYDGTSSISFSGRHADEFAIVKETRHWLKLVTNLAGPFSLFIVGLALIYPLFIFLPSTWIPFILPILSLFLLGIIIFWGGYNFFEWSNDEFIVSTKRVIHIERTIIYGEQREEAPLISITDVIVDTPNFITDYFNYDNVVIKTAGAGDVIFSGIENGERVREAIFTHRAKAQQQVSASNIASIRQSIVERLQWQAEHDLEVAALPAEIPAQQQQKERGFQLPGFIDYYIPCVRETSNGTIKWRQHYWVLLKNIALPLITSLFAFMLMIASLFQMALLDDIFMIQNFYEAEYFIIISVILWVITLVWYTYCYDDWYRDTYELTDSQIIHIDGSAFGLGGEGRQESTLSNIQNTDYASPNFFARLINMGDVTIQTASVGEDFVFKDLYNPLDVQQEIFRRWYKFRDLQTQAMRASEEERFTLWLREYHKMATELSEHK